MSLIRTCLALVSALALGGAAISAAAQEPSALSLDERAAVRCSAAFALAAGMASRGDAVPGYEDIDQRGREYLVRTGARLTSRGWTREQVATAMHAAAAEVAGELQTVLPSCGALLDAAVPALRAPTPLQCTAILQLSATQAAREEAAASQGTEELQALADRLAGRERAAMIAQGADAASAERRLAEARDTMLAQAAEGQGIGSYDIDRCIALARE